MKIETYPSRVLRQRCEELCYETDMDKTFIQNICKKMDIVINDFEAIGLAANQIGIQQRIIAVRPSGIKTTKFMVNPVIVEADGTMIGDEACLSFPGVLVKIKRSAIIIVQYYSPETNKIEKEELMSQEAIIVQHELNHLDGITLAQSAPRTLRASVMNQLKIGKRKFTKVLKRQAKLEKLGAQLQKLDDEAGRKLVEQSNKNTIS